MLQLGLIYRNGNEVVKKDDQKALMWFEEGARKGNPSAIHNVGLAYYKGLNVKILVMVLRGSLRHLSNGY